MATNNSNGTSIWTETVSAWPHQREQDHVANRRTVRQQHDEPIDPDPLPARGRKAVLESPDVILVHGMRLVIAAGAAGELSLEATPLFSRIVQFAERVCDLEPADVQLETFDGVGIVGLLLRQWRDLGRKVIDERRLHEFLFAQRLEDFGSDLPRSHA